MPNYVKPIERRYMVSPGGLETCQMLKDGFWNGPTWLKDESRGTTRKFPTAEAARKAADRAYAKAKANGEQTMDRFYLLSGGETNALFLEG